MTLDPILKEELWRSIVVYFISFLGIGTVIISARLPVDLGLTFPLALIPTCLHCWLMVWYRRKEHIADPSPISILDHALTIQKSHRSTGGHLADAVFAVIIYLIYLLLVRTYPPIPFLWIIVLLIVSGLLARAIFTTDGRYRVTLGRGTLFYLTLSALLIVRFLVLGGPIVPLLIVLGIVGGGTAAILILWAVLTGKTNQPIPRQ